MSRNLAELTDEALRLPEHEQLRLARTLLERSEAIGDVDVEAVWEDEIESRIKLLDSGLAKGRPFTDVLQDIDRQLGRRYQSFLNRQRRSSAGPLPIMNPRRLG